ncbi:hypothetical protein HOD38_02235 [archaeon]|jgi:hypothetical protein|nr:hypothetical protein [archaeon]MBT4397060.1 hypothetical protein [archaeon]MBT4441048.1 hypothetical protein [archaeon]
MNKKGDLTINYLIVFIIAIIVLIIVVIIFRSQVGLFLEKTSTLLTNIFTPVENIDLTQ